MPPTTDPIIVLAYYSLPLTLLWFLIRRATAGLKWVLALFAALVIACGATHLLSIIALAEPLSRLQGPATAVAAVIALATAVLARPVLSASAARPGAVNTGYTDVDGGRLAPEDIARTAGMQQALAELQREVEQHRQLEHHKDELVATVSHELRTPLTSMSGCLSMLTTDDSLSGSERKELGHIALRSTERLIRLVDSLLDLDRIRSGRTEFASAAVSLRTLARMAIQDNGGLAHQYGVILVLVSGDEAGIVQGDADRLTQVLINLISNAIKHAPQGSQVDVAVLRQDDAVRVTVTDQGPGIPPEMLSRVFDRYVQLARPAKAHPEGHGFGLTIARAIVQRHGGTIGVESGEQGTTFYFDLPGHSGQAPDTPQRESHTLIRSA